MQIDLRNTPSTETNIKTLDRQNDLVDFIFLKSLAGYVANNLENGGVSFTLTHYALSIFISHFDFDFKYFELKLSLKPNEDFLILNFFKYIYVDTVLSYSTDTIFYNFSGYYPQYTIKETTTFYHYFFKIEVVKYEDYYHLKITNEFKQFFEKNNLEPLFNGSSIFSKNMLFSVPNLFYYPIQYISSKNINSSFKYFYNVDSYYVTGDIYGDSIMYSTNITTLEISNFNFIQTFYLSFQNLTFGEYAPTFYSGRFIKHTLKIVTPNKIYVYETRDFYENNRILEFETFTLFIHETFIFCIDKVNFLTNSYYQNDYLNILNKSIETVFKLPSIVSSINYKNSLIPNTIAKYSINQEVKYFNQIFKVIFLFFSYSTNNQKEIFYFLQNDTTFLISKEEFLNEI